MRRDVEAKTLLPRARAVHHAAAALLMATAATLLFVPVVFSLLKRHQPAQSPVTQESP